MRACAVLALIALGGCTVKGQGKSAKPDWKMFQVEHPRSAPPGPFRDGPLELRIGEVFLEENKTVFAVSHWVARLRGSVVSAEDLPLSALSGRFTLSGKSGKVYKAHVSTVGPGRRTWQRQEHTGRPTYLPATVAGEIELFVQVGDDRTHDDLEALIFGGVRVPIGEKR